jgi:DNA-binding transcriptional regulator WhiA
MALPTFTIISNETGEVITNSHHAKIRMTKEQFVLAFVRNIAGLYNINVNFEVLNEVLLNMNSQNVVYLQNEFKVKTAEKTKLSIKRIESVILDLVAKNVIKRIQRGQYVVNPSFFGKGSISKIKKLRMQYEGVKIGDDMEVDMNIEREE